MMLYSLLQNRSAVNMMSQVSEDFPDFSNDWATIEALVAVLAPLYGATLEIEKERPPLRIISHF